MLKRSGDIRALMNYMTLMVVNICDIKHCNGEYWGTYFNFLMHINLKTNIIDLILSKNKNGGDTRNYFSVQHCTVSLYLFM